MVTTHNSGAATFMPIDTSKFLLEESRRFYSIAANCTDKELARQLVGIGNVLMGLASEQAELTEEARLTILQDDE